MNKKRFVRKSSLRDSSLIILTCEGEKTEPAYFNGLKTHPDYKSPKIHIEIISRNNSKSAPEYVIKELDSNPNHRWPKKIGTRVYLILESIKRIISH